MPTLWIPGQIRELATVVMIGLALAQSRNSARACAWAPPTTTFRRCRSIIVARHATATSRNDLILPGGHGNNNAPIQYVMAPMVAASDFAFRCLVERHGAQLAFTQMLHARNLVQDPVFRQNHLDFPMSEISTKSQQDCIEGVPLSSSNPSVRRHDAGPLIVQLAGHDTDMMLRAFDVLQEQGCDFAGIDINLGCPQGIARKGDYGAFLHEDNEDLVCDILHKLRQYVPPDYSVSCKIRLPRSLDHVDIKNRIQRLVDTGVSFITIHGRSLEENKTKTGPAHVDLMRLAVDTAGSVPVICNGGIQHFGDLESILETTNAAAVMSSEALLETPNLFSVDSSTLSPQALFQNQVDMALEYIELCSLYPPLPGVLGGHGSFTIVKGHLFKILHRYLTQHVDLRENLTFSTRLVDALSVVEELKRRYSCQDDCESCPSSHADASWYRRHWAANSRVHQKRRPLLQTVQTVEERKEAMKLRIAKLQEARLARKKNERLAASG